MANMKSFGVLSIRVDDRVENIFWYALVLSPASMFELDVLFRIFPWTIDYYTW